MAQVDQTKFWQQDYKASRWIFTAPAGTKLADMLKSQFWAHVSMKLHRGDTISVLADDDSFDVDFRVTAVNRDGPGADVRLLRAWQNDENAIKSELPSVGEFAVEFTQATKWRVLRKSDKSVVKDQFGSKQEAEGHVKSLCGVKG